MPSWSVHLAVAKEINKSLNLNKDIFYIGNLIADIDYDSKVNRRFTHYNKNTESKEKNLPNIKLFIKDYKENLHDPFILGYFSHILTDYYFNNYTYTNYFKNNMDFNELKRLKQNDLILYGKYLFKRNYVEIPKYNKNILKSLDLLKENFIEKKDIEKRIKYLNSEFYDFNKYTTLEKIFGLKFKLFKRKELEKVFKDCTNFILETIKKEVNK